jgi:glycerophosphoryl diester phosphodiesterase
MPRPCVIAHRGASGYLPEHTREAKAAAHAMGADYIEQDVIASRDGVLVVLHDTYLDAVTNVAERFPGRARADGRFYVIDFDYSELASLSVHERTNADARVSGESLSQTWPGRFPAAVGGFRISTFDEELELIGGLNRSTGRRAGIYPEIKDPAWHAQNGVDLTHLVITALESHGFLTAVPDGESPPVYLQCFDASELQRIRHDIDPPIPLVQLLTGEDDTSAESLERISAYAQGIGPPYFSLIRETNGAIEPNALCVQAHGAGLAVHPYTFRKDQLPAFADTFAALVGFFAAEVGIDGLFTDFPDTAISILDAMNLD